MLGKEASIILDFAFNIGGSEALAETYFAIMKSQYQDNQDPETMDMRTIINFCLPELSKCPVSLQEIVNIYREGDVRQKVSRHRSNIFYDSRQRAVGKYTVSKSVDRVRCESKGAPYMK